MSHPMYGRVQVAEPLSALASLHQHDGTALRETDHETPIGVLDQSDLTQQGIHTSAFIPGCKVDASALGSCTANATMEALARLIPEASFLARCNSFIACAAEASPTNYADTAGIERGAIGFYHICTWQTAQPSEEWPPTDCGSSGPYIVSELVRLGLIRGAKVGTAGESLISLLQTDCVLMGSPWFYAWEEPDAQGFIDGNGTPADLEAAIQSGVAGGHETTLVAIEKLALLPTGQIDPTKTVLRGRNHWRKSWGDEGCYRVHLSTLQAINSYCDFRQLVL